MCTYNYISFHNPAIWDSNNIEWQNEEIFIREHANSVNQVTRKLRNKTPRDISIITIREIQIKK